MRTNKIFLIVGPVQIGKAQALFDQSQVEVIENKKFDSVEKKDVFKNAEESIKELSKSIETFYGSPKRYGKGDRRKNKLKFKNQFR